MSLRFGLTRESEIFFHCVDSGFSNDLHGPLFLCLMGNLVTLFVVSRFASIKQFSFPEHYQSVKSSLNPDQD